MSPTVEVMFRPVVEMVLSLIKLSASAAPKPTLLAVTVPSATVVALPLCVALASTEATVSNPPLPMVAIESFPTIAKATAGLAAIPPAEPAFTLVSLLLSEVDERFKAAALFKNTLS